ncbi:MAG: Gfo/Idh/MocA family oxidoreductase [Bryobacterales bacterium]|nr:Gfo/Idh/MocA family oxidoreductase [Bryobacterales bacterium]
MSTPPSSRRSFVAAAGGLFSMAAANRVLGANDRVRIAVCGVNGRGWDHVRQFAKQPNVEVVAICDVDENVINKRLAGMEKLNLPKPASYVDVRKLLDDKSIDAVSVATPNDWHALITIWGCQAGKDVYVEKPCSHNWWEGRKIVEAARKYDRIVQHGTQARSQGSAIEAVEKLHNGVIGEVYLARGLCYKRRHGIGHTPVSPVPAGVHYDLWTGPAPLRPFTRNHFHYNWHWFWDYGNGDLGNQGIHQVDMARHALQVTFPNKVSAMGGHFVFDDDQQTPNLLNCTFQYDLAGGKRKIIEFEVRNWITNREAGIGTEQMYSGDEGYNTVGDIFYGSNGYLAIGDEDVRNGFRSYIGENMKPGPTAHEGGDHFANFIDVVRSRRREDLHAPIEEGHVSCTLVHLANASYRLGRMLHFDPATEQVIGDDEANRLLCEEGRGYRKPFVIPDKV